MKRIMTVISVAAAAMLLAACGQKQEPAAAPAAEAPAEAPAPAPEPAPAPMAPADDSSEDAAQSGGDKVDPEAGGDKVRE
jgi:2-oxoglutarate dehydrogenase E2 component (dihydrolipoamide succinyltransferase)